MSIYRGQRTGELRTVKLLYDIKYGALSNWYAVIDGIPHIVRYSWSMTVPPVAYFSYHVDAVRVHHGVQELITSSVIGKNVDRFQWNGHNFMRRARELTVDGSLATETCQLGGVNTAWFVEVEHLVHIVQFSHVSALGAAIGSATVGWVGTIMGTAVDWLLDRVTSGFPAVRVWFDGELIHKQSGVNLDGEITRFQRDGHVYNVAWDRIHGPALTIDGIRLGLSRGNEEKFGSSRLGQRFSGISDELITEISEIVSVEVYPLDNRQGSETVTNIQEVSKTVSNELVFDRNIEGVGQASLDLPELFRFVRADLSVKLASHTGHTIGEIVTRHQTIKMSAAPRTQVTYTLTWKRKVRSGLYLVRVDEQDVAVPYTAYLDLTVELSTSRLT